jgi:hypothetical protein
VHQQFAEEGYLIFVELILPVHRPPLILTNSNSAI